MPDVLPLAQQGVPNYNLQGWIALIGPPCLPAATVSKLYSDTKTILGTKEAQEALAAQGSISMGTSPEATTTLFQAEAARYANLVKESGMTID